MAHTGGTDQASKWAVPRFHVLQQAKPLILAQKLSPCVKVCCAAGIAAKSRQHKYVSEGHQDSADMSCRNRTPLGSQRPFEQGASPFQSGSIHPINACPSDASRTYNSQCACTRITKYSPLFSDCAKKVHSSSVASHACMPERQIETGYLPTIKETFPVYGLQQIHSQPDGQNLRSDMQPSPAFKIQHNSIPRNKYRPHDIYRILNTSPAYFENLNNESSVAQLNLVNRNDYFNAGESQLRQNYYFTAHLNRFHRHDLGPDKQKVHQFQNEQLHWQTFQGAISHGRPHPSQQNLHSTKYFHHQIFNPMNSPENKTQVDLSPLKQIELRHFCSDKHAVSNSYIRDVKDSSFPKKRRILRSSRGITTKRSLQKNYDCNVSRNSQKLRESETCLVVTGTNPFPDSEMNWDNSCSCLNKGTLQAECAQRLQDNDTNGRVHHTENNICRERGRHVSTKEMFLDSRSVSRPTKPILDLNSVTDFPKCTRAAVTCFSPPRTILRSHLNTCGRETTSKLDNYFESNTSLPFIGSNELALETINSYKNDSLDTLRHSETIEDNQLDQCHNILRAADCNWGVGKYDELSKSDYETYTSEGYACTDISNNLSLPSDQLTDYSDNIIPEKSDQHNECNDRITIQHRNQFTDYSHRIIPQQDGPSRNYTDQITLQHDGQSSDYMGRISPQLDDQCSDCTGRITQHSGQSSDYTGRLTPQHGGQSSDYTGRLTPQHGGQSSDYIGRISHQLDGQSRDYTGRIDSQQDGQTSYNIGRISPQLNGQCSDYSGRITQHGGQSSDYTGRLTPQHDGQSSDYTGRLTPQHGGQSSDYTGRLTPQHAGQSSDYTGRLTPQHGGQSSDYTGTLTPQHGGQSSDYIGRISHQLDGQSRDYTGRIGSQHDGQSSYNIGRISPQLDGQCSDYTGRITQHGGQSSDYTGRLTPQHGGQSRYYTDRLSPQHGGFQNIDYKGRLSPQHGGQSSDYNGRISPQHGGQSSDYTGRISHQLDGQSRDYTGRIGSQHDGQSSYNIGRISPQLDGQCSDYTGRITQHGGQSSDYTGRLTPQHGGQSRYYTDRLSPQHGGFQNIDYKGRLSPQHGGQSSDYNGRISPQHGGQSSDCTGRLTPQHDGQSSDYTGRLTPQQGDQSYFYNFTIIPQQGDHPFKYNYTIIPRKGDNSKTGQISPQTEKSPGDNVLASIIRPENDEDVTDHDYTYEENKEDKELITDDDTLNLKIIKVESLSNKLKELPENRIEEKADKSNICDALGVSQHFPSTHNMPDLLYADSEVDCEIIESVNTQLLTLTKDNPPKPILADDFTPESVLAKNETILAADNVLAKNIQLEVRLGRLYPAGSPYVSSSATKPKLMTERKRALRFITPGWFICDVCRSTFANPSDCVQHVEEHKLARAYICNRCRVVFSGCTSYCRHKAKTKEKPEKCPDCPKQATTICRILKHSVRAGHFGMSVPRQIKKAEGTKSKSNVKNVNLSEISCKICNRRFFSHLGFKVHFSKMHANAKAGDYPCNICNKSFVSYFRFKIHFSKVHTSIDVSAVKKKHRNGHKDDSLSPDTWVNIPQNEGRADHGKMAYGKQLNLELKAGKVREHVCTICTKRFASPLGFKIHSARMHASGKSRVAMKKRKEEHQDGGKFSHNRSAYIPQSRTEFSDSNVPFQSRTEFSDSNVSFQSRRKLSHNNRVLVKPPMKMSYNSGIYVQPHKLSHKTVHLQPQAKRSHDISRHVQPQAKGSYDNGTNVKLQAKISHASSKHIQSLAELLDDNSKHVQPQAIISDNNRIQVQPCDISEHTEKKAFSCNDYDHVDAKTVADDSLKECDSRWSSDSEEMLIAHVSDEGWLWTSVTGNVAET